jgi:peptidyl-prolyl cis-trans isomerase C
LLAPGIALIISISGVRADDSASDPDILAQRGKGVVTQEEFAARADAIPEDARFAALRNRNRLQELLNMMLLQKQLAAAAREAGFDKKEIVIDRMQLAADAELAKAWVQHYVASQPDADYEELAREYYEAHKGKILSSPKIDVSHILISTKKHSDKEAKELAASVFKQLLKSPSAFDDLVAKYSEDPSAASNKGHFKNVRKGQMVKPFEEVAFRLKPGEISEPVKSTYGYHIIRLDKYIKPVQMTFDEVKDKLVAKEKEKFQDRIRQDYLNHFTAMNVEMTKEALEEMTKRVFGDEKPDEQAGSGNSE